MKIYLVTLGQQAAYCILDVCDSHEKALKYVERFIERERQLENSQEPLFTKTGEDVWRVTEGEKYGDYLVITSQIVR